MTGPAASVAAAVDGDALVGLVREAVAVPSVTLDEGAFAGWVKDRLEAGGWDEVELVEAAPGRPNVYARTGGGQGETRSVVLAGHLDTVHAEDWVEEWKDTDRADPFAGHVAAGEIWGRGVTDQKGGICSIIEAVRAIDRAGYRPAGQVTGLFVCDEESARPAAGSPWDARRGA